MTSATTVFACPGCGAATPAGTTRCEQCRIRLSGELAMQLWRLDQQLASLTAQRVRLVELLRSDRAPTTPPPFVIAAAPGTETRRLLLLLGAICLVAALTAGTALIWPALGVGGQSAVLVLLTAALLIGATRLRRLPATAEAIAAVGVAAVAIDVIAGRRLLAPGLSGAGEQVYFIGASAFAAIALAAVAMRAKWLKAPAAGAVGAVFATVAAVVNTGSVDGFALLGLLEFLVAGCALWLASSLRMSVVAVRAASLCGVVGFAVMTVGASMFAAADHSAALWCGVAVGVAVAATCRWELGAAGGVVAGSLLLVGDVVPVHSASLTVAGVAGAALLIGWLPPTAQWHVRGRAFGLGVAGVVEVAAQLVMLHASFDTHDHAPVAAGLVILALLFGSGAAFATPNYAAAIAAAMTALSGIGALAEAAAPQGSGFAAETVAVVSLGVYALATLAALLSRRDRDYAVARSVAVVAGAAGSLATGIALHLHAVGTAEAYVVVPAVTGTVTGVVAMRRHPRLPSWVLAPAVAALLLPSLSLALHGDLSRQVLVLCVGAALVAVGAQQRLVCPLAAGSVAMLLVVVRVLGPQIVVLPRWLTLGVLGASLLLLGATWERRLQQVRLAAGRLRPVVASLR